MCVIGWQYGSDGCVLSDVSTAVMGVCYRICQYGSDGCVLSDVSTAVMGVCYQMSVRQ